jgi:hypothetical protein
MTTQTTAAGRLPWRQIVKVGMFNAVLATVVPAVAVPLFYGAGTEWPVNPAAGMHPVRMLPNWFPDPLEFVKAALLLCPITAVSCGSYGMAAGMAGGIAMCFRRRRILASGCYFREAAVAGFLIGVSILFIDGLLNWGSGLFSLLAPVFGALFALLSAMVFRKRYLGKTSPG